MSGFGSLEVGEALNSQAAHIIAANEKICTFIQVTSEKIAKKDSELKAVRLELQNIKRKEEEHKVGLNECKAQDEKIGDSLGQLERKVGEVAEGNRVLSQQVQGVGQQVQTLQQDQVSPKDPRR